MLCDLNVFTNLIFITVFIPLTLVNTSFFMTSKFLFLLNLPVIIKLDIRNFWETCFVEICFTSTLHLTKWTNFSSGSNILKSVPDVSIIMSRLSSNLKSYNYYRILSDIQSLILLWMVLWQQAFALLLLYAELQNWLN